MFCLGMLLKTVVKCSINGQIALQKQIVGHFMHSLDTNYDETDDPLSSKIACGYKNPPTGVQDALDELTPDCYVKVRDYLENNLIKLINSNKRGLLVKTISLMIIDDEDIEPDSEVEVISKTKKKELTGETNDLAAFLAGVYIYVLRNTDNVNEKGVVVKTVNHYLDKASEYKFSKIVIDETNKEEINGNNSLISKNKHLRFFEGTGFTTIGVAIVIGRWCEKDSADIKLFEKLSGKLYSDSYEDLKVYIENGVSYDEGHLSVEDLNQLRYEVIHEIDDLHLQYLFNVLKEFLLQYNGELKYSEGWREGIIDFLAFAGANIQKSNRIDRLTWQNNIYLFEKDIFLKGSDYSLINLFSVSTVILEADIKSILCVIKDNIAQEESNLVRLLRRDNNSAIAYPLADLLRKAALHQSYFTQTMSIFFELKQYNEIFTKYMKCIMHPWYPQTNADIDARMGIIKFLYRKDKEFAWELASDLLLGFSTSSYRINEYKYLPIGVKENTSADVSRYISSIVGFVCDNTDRSYEQLSKLINVIPYIDIDDARIIETALLKENIGDDAELLYGDLQRIINNSTELSDDYNILLDTLKSHFAQGEKTFFDKELFSFESELYKEKTFEKASRFISKIYREHGMEAIIKFSESVEDVQFLTNVIYQVLALDEYYLLIEKASIFDNRRLLVDLINNLTSESIIAYVDTDKGNRFDLLAEHSISKEIIEYVATLSDSLIDRFWSKVTISGCIILPKKQFDIVIKEFLQNRRFEDAIILLASRSDDHPVNIKYIYTALDNYSGINREIERNNRSINFSIKKLIWYLQENEKSNTNRIAEFEKKYILILAPFDVVRPRYIYYKMANDPEYVESLIEEKYNMLESDDSSAATLLMYFRMIPGSDKNGKFSFEKFLEWDKYIYDLPDEKIKSDMLYLFYRLLVYAPCDEDGFIIDRRVADYVESAQNHNMITAMEVEIINSVGGIDLSSKADFDNKLSTLQEKIKCFENEGYIVIASIYRSAVDSITLMEEL